MRKALLTSSLAALGLVLLAACSGTTDYFESKDIDHLSWSVTDSVLFPIHVVDNPDVLNPVKCGYDYDITLSCRHTFEYPYQQLPIVVSFQQMDSLGWQPWNRPLKITIPTVDQEGYLEGGGWGSLYKKELQITGRKLRFPVPGDYRIVILPDTLLEGVVSMTVELN